MLLLLWLWSHLAWSHHDHWTASQYSIVRVARTDLRYPLAIICHIPRRCFRAELAFVLEAPYRHSDVRVQVEAKASPNPVRIDAMPAMPKDKYGQPLRNLTVFIVAHSHDDLGWQRNVDQV